MTRRFALADLGRKKTKTYQAITTCFLAHATDAEAAVHRWELETQACHWAG